MTHTSLITSLQNAELYEHSVDNFSTLETHCSWVILTGSYAYKIKKPVDFGFLNYSNLKKRKHFCEEEVKRNQGLAKQIYLTVVPIYGSPDKPNFSGKGDIIEYAVKMREFSQEGLLSQLQAKKQLTPPIIDKLAHNLGNFHLQAEAVPTTSKIGSSEHAQQQTRDNFSQTLPLLENEADKEELQQLCDKVEMLYAKIKSTIDRRKASGLVKQCHGDVHLNNITLINDEPVIFDCIDFNDDFCWTDTMADLGFITMDLDEFGECDLSWRLLNQYLQISGDYDGLQVLAYFQAYRAMVRAKVAIFSLIHGATATDETKDEHYRRYKGCVALAQTYLEMKPLKMLITCGVSASGKSTVATKLCQNLKLIMLTSDRERKRQANIELQTDCTAPVLDGLYHPQQTEKTYTTLLQLSETILTAGYPVLIDATFIEKQYRQQFSTLALKFSIPFFILYCHAPEEQLHQWLAGRQTNISEATQDVLSMQLEAFESPLGDEEAQTISICTAEPVAFVTIEEKINAHADAEKEQNCELDHPIQKSL